MRNGAERRLFIAATNQNNGKTTSSLGLVKGFADLGKHVGFVKPVGQRFVEEDGYQVDEDCLLIHRACGLGCLLTEMSPIVVGKDFTRQYLDDPDAFNSTLQRDVMESFAMAAEGNELVVVEGTGHAGVGSVFGMSNARVAKLLNAKALIVTLGGIGRPVDEVAVNRSLFEKEGVPVIGVLVNKVIPDRLEQTRVYLEKAFDQCGISLLGVVPYVSRLAWPTVQHVVDSMDAKVMNGTDRLANPIADVIVGAMTSPNAISYIQDKTLLIVPGDRDDVVLAAVSVELTRTDVKLAGILLTRGVELQPQTLDLISRTDIPTLMVDLGTYEAAAHMQDILVKIRVTEKEKIDLATSLVREHVDFDRIWSLLE